MISNPKVNCTITKLSLVFLRVIMEKLTNKPSLLPSRKIFINYKSLFFNYIFILYRGFFFFFSFDESLLGAFTLTI